MNKKLVTVLGFLGLYMLTTGIAWAGFTMFSGSTQSSSELQDERDRIASLPKTEVCPLNGQKYSEVEREIWEKRRPMAVVIENHMDSRPQSGLSKADIVYEIVAEGGITRFLALFYCGAAAEDVTIGPIRSARVYLINWAAEYGPEPLFVHYGGANNICGNCPGGIKPRGQVNPRVQALEKLINMGWRHSTGNALDGGANVSYPAIKRDQYRLGTESAWEHSAIGSTDLLFDLGIERGFGYKTDSGDPWVDEFELWKFADDNPAVPEASSIAFEFWRNKPDFDVRWEYDQTSNYYKRFNGSQPHTDLEFDKPQLIAKNVLVMFVEEEGPVDTELHMYYEVIGKGEMLLFQNGRVTEGTWEKDVISSRTKFMDENGDEISFVRGPIWIEAVPQGNDVVY